MSGSKLEYSHSSSRPPWKPTIGSSVCRWEHITADGRITTAPSGGELTGRSPVDRGEQGMKRSLLVDGYGIPLGRALAPANCNGSPLLAPTLDKLDDLGPLPDDITVHLDAGYDPAKTRDGPEAPEIAPAEDAAP